MRSARRFCFVAKPTDSPKGGWEQIARYADQNQVAAIFGPTKQTFTASPHPPLPAAEAYPTEDRPTRTIAIGISTCEPRPCITLFGNSRDSPVAFSLSTQHMSPKVYGNVRSAIEHSSPIHVWRLCPVISLPARNDRFCLSRQPPYENLPFPREHATQMLTNH